MADRSETTSNKLKALSGVTAVALIGVIGAGAVVGSSSAANSLEPEARKALDSAGLSQVNVEFDGREAELSGGSDLDRDRAKKVVEGLDGVRWAKTDDGDAGADDSAASLKLKRDGSTTRLSGAVPDAATANKINKSAKATFGGKIVDELKIDKSLDAPAWGDNIGSALPNLVGVKDLEFEANDSTVKIGGDIESAVGRDKVVKLVAESLPDTDIQSDLEIDPGSLSAKDAATVNGSTVYFKRGSSALSKKSRAKLHKLAKVLTKNPEVAINISGYAEPGTKTVGTRVSQARVDAVEKYLVAAKVAPKRLMSKSYGADKQAGDNPRDQKYRRVEFVVKEN